MGVLFPAQPKKGAERGWRQPPFSSKRSPRGACLQECSKIGNLDLEVAPFSPHFPNPGDRGEDDLKCKLHCGRQQVGPGCAAPGWGDPVTLGALCAPDSGRAAARASASRLRPDNERFLCEGPGGQTGSGPAPSAGPAAAAHRWFSVREGRPRHFYITIELCAPGMRPRRRRGPRRPRLHPAPEPRRLRPK